MKIITRENKIKRLKWQIEEIRESMNGKPNQQMKEAIERREEAINYLSDKNADWQTLRRLFGFNYCGFNLNHGLTLFGPRRKRI